jgi:lysozyme
MRVSSRTSTVPSRGRYDRLRPSRPPWACVRRSIRGPFVDGVDEQRATELLRQDVLYAEHAVEHQVKVPLTQGQCDVLVSFTYNEGSGRLQSSTLLKLLNVGNFVAVPDEFRMWVYGSGKKLSGLVARRDAERIMFLG